MAWVEILPRLALLFRQEDWDSAAAFLGWSGILVNRHRHRQVEHVTFSACGLASTEHHAGAKPQAESFYLKKEFAVTWRDRFRNAWHGFGWCATAVREAAMLQALRAAGIGCPEVVALGEDGRSAFVLTRDESDMQELRLLVPTLDEPARIRLADSLGRELARMHEAGFEHPDLFAKHILAARLDATFRFCILDWQRGRRRRLLSWRLRCRDLAILDATLHEALAGDRLRLRLLRAYRQASIETPPLGRMARSIRAMAQRLREQRHIREIGQLPTPAGDQQFVPLCAGRLLVVRSYFEELGSQAPVWLTDLVEPEGQGNSLACALGSERSLTMWPNRGPDWDIPPLAHALFRLQRFGVAAPRLLAVGCGGQQVFLLAECPPTSPFGDMFAKAAPPVRRRLLHQAGAMVRRLHEAGYHLAPGDSWERRLGVVAATGALVLVNIEPLLRSRRPWQELAPQDLKRQRILLTPAEQLQVLHGYGRERQTV